MAINLQKGQTINLRKEEFDLSKVTIGLGWRVREEKKGFLGSLLGGKQEDYDLDAISWLIFDKPFLAPYAVSASGTSALGATVNIIVINDSALDKFTIKVTADCVVRWNAKIMTQ